MSGEAPLGSLGFVIRFEVMRPEDLPFVGAQAEQVTLGSQRIDFAAVHRRRAARPGGVGDIVRAVVFVLPDFLAIGSVQAKDPFFSFHFAPGVWIRLGVPRAADVVHDVDPAPATAGPA